MQTLGKQKTLWVGAAAAAFVVGLLIGWMFLGWVVAPVQWVNADPVDLHESAKEAYVVMAADSFALNGNIQLAQERLQSFSHTELANLLGRMRKAAPDSESRQRLDRLAEAVKVNPTTVENLPSTSGKTKEGGISGSWLTLLGGLILILLIAGGGAVGYRRLQAGGKGGRLGAGLLRQTAAPKERIGRKISPERTTMPSSAPTLPFRKEAFSPPTESLGHFSTTYKLGDDGYDTSFSIETPAGEFLGECGVGISEILDDGPPQKVTAFELWLFDKNDIRTVTKVLMSEHAYNDPDLMAKLKPKGDLVIAQPGELLILETATLRVQVQIAEMDYGWEGNLPPRSYFEHLLVEMTPTAKELGEASPPAAA